MTGEVAVPSLRAFDRARDFEPLAALILDVNVHDDLDWRPTATELAHDWAHAATFDADHDAVVVESSGRLLATGWVEWSERAGRVVHNFEIWVHPDQRRRGFGRGILAWLEDRAHASVADGTGGPPELPHGLGGGVMMSDPAAVAFAERMGYTTVRFGFEMRRPLDLPIAHVALPDGIEVRPVLPEHHRAIWEADVEAFRDHWEARVRSEDDLDRWFAGPNFDPTMWQVAWAGDEVAGVVMNTIYADQNVRNGIEIGWLDHVSVRRPWRGRGLASALVARSLAVHRDRGMAVAALGVDAENPTGALRLYEKHGFRPHARWAVVRKAW